MDTSHHTGAVRLADIQILADILLVAYILSTQIYYHEMYGAEQNIFIKSLNSLFLLTSNPCFVPDLRDESLPPSVINRFYYMTLFALT